MAQPKNIIKLVDIFSFTFKLEKPIYPAEVPKTNVELKKDFNFHVLVFQKGQPENCKINLGMVPPTRARNLTMLIKKAKK